MSNRRINLADYPIRHTPVLEWIRANNLEPGNLLYDQEVDITDGRLTITEFVFEETADGRRVKRIYGDVAVTKQVTVPLISAPENHGL